MVPPRQPDLWTITFKNFMPFMVENPSAGPAGRFKPARCEPITLADVKLSDSVTTRLWKDIVAKATA